MYRLCNCTQFALRNPPPASLYNSVRSKSAWSSFYLYFDMTYSFHGRAFLVAVSRTPLLEEAVLPRFVVTLAHSSLSLSPLSVTILLHKRAVLYEIIVLFRNRSNVLHHLSATYREGGLFPNPSSPFYTILFLFHYIIYKIVQVKVIQFKLFTVQLMASSLSHQGCSDHSTRYWTQDVVVFNPEFT